MIKLFSKDLAEMLSIRSQGLERFVGSP
jgi:hypothetical protein